MTTLMWEVKAAEGRTDELAAHALATADPAAAVYRSADHRIVVIDPTGRGVADVPAELVAHPPHVWSFERLHR